MKRIGVLGGMSWESSVEYERIINTAVRERLGGSHSADLLVRSYDFAEIEALQATGGWDALAERLSADARALEAAGAQLLVIATNTMHVVAPQVRGVGHHPAAPHRRCHRRRRPRGRTRYGRTSRHALHDGAGVLPRSPRREPASPHSSPTSPTARCVHDVIYRELVSGVISEESRAEYLAVITRLRERGAQGVIAGCTEIELLIRESDLDCPLFPTARLHALAAVDAALAE